MPLTSPGNDDGTGENHQPTLRKNTAEPAQQTLKQYRPVRRFAEPLQDELTDAVLINRHLGTQSGRGFVTLLLGCRRRPAEHGLIRGCPTA